MAVDIPSHPHGRFINRLNQTYKRLTIRYYLGKMGGSKHQWAAQCSCGSGFIVVSSNINVTYSCGCYSKEQTKKANIGNKSGSLNIKTQNTINKLSIIKPEYQVVNSYDGRVMSKWDFFCGNCCQNFSARPDNILDRKSGGSQTPCDCCLRGGYSKFKDGTIYVLSSKDYCKFGITNNYDKRYKQLSKSIGEELKLEFILTIPYDGSLVHEIERNIKNKFDYRVDVGIIDGRTEYRLLSDKESIIKEIINFCFNYEL